MWESGTVTSSAPSFFLFSREGLVLTKVLSEEVGPQASFKDARTSGDVYFTTSMINVLRIGR